MVDADHHDMGFLHEFEQIMEWWKLIITTCVTVWSALVIGNKSWTTIFTAYFFAGILMLTLNGPDGVIMAQSKFLDGWGLTSCIPILTRFVIGMYEEVRQELLLQEKEKRQRVLYPYFD